MVSVCHFLDKRTSISFKYNGTERGAHLLFAVVRNEGWVGGSV